LQLQSLRGLPTDFIKFSTLKLGWNYVLLNPPFGGFYRKGLMKKFELTNKLNALNTNNLAVNCIFSVINDEKPGIYLSVWSRLN